jgi:type I restriction enzyme S subunit
MTTISKPVWSVSTIGEQFDVQLGKRFDAAVNRGIPKPCMSNRGVRWGRIEPSKVVVAPLTPVDVATLRLINGDVLVCEGGEVGRASVWRDELPECYFQNTLHRLRPRSEYDPRVLVAFLHLWAMTGRLWALVGKSSIAHLTKENLLRVPIPVPTQAEQEAMASALDDVDHLITILEQLIAKKQAIKHGMMRELLTGKTRLPGFKEPWSNVPLIELANGRRDLFNDGDWIETPHIAATGNRLLQTGNIGVGRLTDAGKRRYISDESFEKLRCKEVVPGDILICRLAAPAGRACLVPEIGERRMLTSVDVTIFRPDETKADRRYLVAVMSTPWWLKEVAERSAGSTRTRIARSEMGRIQVSLPTRAEQSRIADVISDADSEVDALYARLALAEAVKQGMMQALLTGRTRLPVAEAVA